MITKKELSEQLRTKYGIQDGIPVNSHSLTEAFQKKLLKEIKKKEVHNQLFKEINEITETKESANWLVRGRLNPKGNSATYKIETYSTTKPNARIVTKHKPRQTI